MSYQKWISVNLEHVYFADGRCSSMQFGPTDDCRKQMRRKGQFFFPVPNGFFIFQDTTQIKNNQNSSDESSFFDIAVHSRDGFFGNYSNLEIDYRKGKVYYVGSTLKTGSDNSTEKRITLSDPVSGKEVEAVPVFLEPKQFVISLDNAAPGDTFKLLDKNNTVVEQRQVKDKTSGASLYVDVKRKNAGIYSLEKNNNISAYFYADDMLYNTKPALIIGIEAAFPTGTGKEKTGVQTYDIRIANRSVYWQYHVIGRTNGRKLNNLEIRNNNEKLLPGVKFEQVRIDKERQEAVFVSNKPVPIWEKAFQSIELIEKGNNGTPLVPHLANADISSLHVREGEWVSQIYVYI
jgi:hypothetical protein